MTATGSRTDDAMVRQQLELRVCRVSDDRAGHLAQTAGLAAALGTLTPVLETQVRRGHAATALAGWLIGSSLPADGPSIAVGNAALRGTADLILCCGHATHLTGLALRRAVGGRLVVLMRPSLPNCLFDLVVAPRHDGLSESGRVLLTDGVLNPLTTTGLHDPRRGLMLLGGPSRHHGWDEGAVLEQVRTLAAASPGVAWALTTSRRTPASTLQVLTSLSLPNLAVTPLGSTPPGWVAQQLADCATVWITEDSVSMVYEALTAGVAVGLLQVPVRRDSRVVRGMRALAAAGRVTPFAAWQGGEPLARGEPLAEADRVAKEILRRWFPDRLGADGVTPR